MLGNSQSLINVNLDISLIYLVGGEGKYFFFSRAPRL